MRAANRPAAKKSPSRHLAAAVVSFWWQLFESFDSPFTEGEFFFGWSPFLDASKDASICVVNITDAVHGAKRNQFQTMALIKIANLHDVLIQ